MVRNAPPRTSTVDQTPTTCRQVTTPYQVGPASGGACTPFRTPHPFSPMSPQASVQLLVSLDLVAMEGEEPPSPCNPSYATPSPGARSDDSTPASPSTASTASCSTEGSFKGCFTF